MTIIPSITPVIGKFDPEDLLDVEEETLYDDTINLLLVQQNASSSKDSYFAGCLVRE